MPRLARPPFASRPLPRRRAALAVLSLLALVSGCAVGPDFATPAAPDVASYTAPQEAPSASGGQQLQAGVDIPAQWWQLFHSDALDQLVRQALDANPTLEQARASLRQATEDLNAETGGRLLPAVDGNLSAARKKVDPSAYGVPVSELPPPFTLYNASIDVSYTLDRVRRQPPGAGRHGRPGGLSGARTAGGAHVAGRERGDGRHPASRLVRTDGRDPRTAGRASAAAGHHATAPGRGRHRAGRPEQPGTAGGPDPFHPAAAGQATGTGHAPAGGLPGPAAGRTARSTATPGRPDFARKHPHRRAVRADATAARHPGRRSAVAQSVGRMWAWPPPTSIRSSR